MWITSFRPTGAYTLPPRGPESDRMSRNPDGLGALGVKLFLASLSFLFAASIVLYLVLLLPAERPELPLLPVVGAGLGVATVVMLASSWTYSKALAAIRLDDRPRFAKLMRWTLVLGLAFMLIQSVNWAQLVGSDLELFAPRLELGTDPQPGGLFLVLTVLHALHVVGGLVPLALVTRRAGRGDYTAGHHDGAANVALYWHFLDVVWILMLIAIVAVSL